MPDQRSAGELVTETFDYDGGRPVTVYIPADPPEAVVFAGDGQLISQWSGALEAADGPPVMIVGVHRRADETLRLHEYSPGFDPDRFAAHEEFFVGDVRRWARSRFGVALPAGRTAVFGVSAGGELALAIGLRHPDVYGAVFCASPGGGYRPPTAMPRPIPRTYLVAGTQEPFFLENATRWAAALRDAGADVLMTERAGSHGGAFWREEFPLMVAWAFGGLGGANAGRLFPFGQACGMVAWGLQVGDAMYQSFPAPGPAQEPPGIQSPLSVRNAVKLMYAGAALEVIALIVTILTISSLKSSILKAHAGYTAAQLHSAEVDRASSLVVGAVIAIGLWLWMAWATGHGRSWARILSALFFGINTLDLIVSFVLVSAPATMTVGVVIWLVGLAAIVLLFSKKSGPFYSQQISTA